MKVKRLILWAVVGSALVVVLVGTGILIGVRSVLQTDSAAEADSPLPAQTVETKIESPDEPDWFAEAVSELQPQLRGIIPRATSSANQLVLSAKASASNESDIYRITRRAPKTQDDGWRSSDQVTGLVGGPIRCRIEIASQRQVSLQVQPVYASGKPRFTIQPGCRLVLMMGDRQEPVAYIPSRLEFTGERQDDGTYYHRAAVVFPGRVWMFDDTWIGQWLSLLPPSAEDPYSQALAHLGAHRLPVDFVQLAMAIRTDVVQPDNASIPLLQHPLYTPYIHLLVAQMGGESAYRETAQVEQVVDDLQQEPTLYVLPESLMRVLYHPRVAAAAEALAVSTDSLVTKDVLLDIAAAGGSPFDRRTSDELFGLMIDAATPYDVAWYALLLDHRGDPRGTAMVAELAHYPASLPFFNFASPTFREYTLRRQHSFLNEYLQKHGGWQGLACSEADLSALRQRMLSLDRGCGPWIKAAIQAYSLHPDEMVANGALSQACRAPALDTLDFLTKVAASSSIKRHRQRALDQLDEPVWQALMVLP